MARARRLRLEQRRARRRALVRRVTPTTRRRAWLLGRRSPAQRAVLLFGGISAIWLIWYLVGPLVLRIAFTLLFLLLLPVLAVVAFDRRV